MRRLIVISNHAPDKWSKEQRAGWDIVYIPHPYIKADMDRQELVRIVTDLFRDEVLPHIENIHNTYFCIQGDYGFTFLMQQEVLYSCYPDLNQFVFPTTERFSQERELPDGTVVKEQLFKFVQWR